MSVTDYFHQIQKEISSSALIIDIRLTYEERSPYVGYVSGTIVVEGGAEIHIREYIDVRYGIKHLKYAYHCMLGRRFLFRYEGLEWLIEKGLILQKDAGTATAECIAWQINRQLLKEKLDGLCKLQSEDENAARLIKRLERFKGELLTFADYPVEYHNNRAERALRPLVVTRKISYGSQTEQGAKATCIMMSILQTCQIRGIDFGQFIRDAITGRVSEKRLIRRLLGNKREEDEPSRSPP